MAVVPRPVRAAKIAPSAAAPTAPPRPRKKLVVAIAIPSCSRDTLFWTAAISTCPTIPNPSPKTTRPIAVAVRLVIVGSAVARIV